MKRKHKKTLMVALVVLLVCGIYMSNIVMYALMRDNMKFAQENAMKGGWTIELENDYNEAQAEIMNSSNVIVQLMYNYHTPMMVVTTLVMIVMVAALLRVAAVIDFYSAVTRRRRRHA